MSGYEIAEIAVGAESPAVGQRVADVLWPPGCVVVAVTADHQIGDLESDAELAAGDRVILLVPALPESADRPLPAATL